MKTDISQVKIIKEAELNDKWYNSRFQQTAKAYPEYLKLLDENSIVTIILYSLKH